MEKKFYFMQLNYVFLFFLILINSSYTLSKNTHYVNAIGNKDVFSTTKYENKNTQNLGTNEDQLKHFDFEGNEFEVPNVKEKLSGQNQKSDEFEREFIIDTRYNNSQNNSVIINDKFLPKEKENISTKIKSSNALHSNTNKDNSLIELGSNIMFVDKKYGMSFIQSKINPAHLNSEGTFMISLTSTETNRLSRFFWAMIIVSIMSLICFFLATNSQEKLNKMKANDLNVITNNILKINGEIRI